jgi:hypothetical protein
MKTKVIILLIGITISYYSFSQNNNKYLFPHKTENFSQLDWLEIMSELANDTFVLNRMKGIEKGPIVISHLPYVCKINDEHPIIVQFCPECIWTIDSCKGASCVTNVSISSDRSYGFHLDNVYTQDMWNQGDTITGLFFTIHTEAASRNENTQCVMIPIISNIIIPAYSIFPSKRKLNK